MNKEKFQSIIEISIKSEKLRQDLLNCLERECELNSLSPSKFLVDKASERFKNKIKAVQQIEKDLPDNLISPSDTYFLLPQLENLRCQLVASYANLLGNKITEEKKNEYNEIKDFILKFLGLNIKLKLKYFNLTIILLKKILADSKSNKELMSAFDLLKLFMNSPDIHPNEQDLYHINHLTYGVDKADTKEIRSYFFGIICELNEKLLFQDLLNQLLEILKTQIPSPLAHFATIFTNKCINDPKLERHDFNQIISLVYHALAYYNDEVIVKKNVFFKKIVNSKKLSDYLAEFQETFKAKIFQLIDNDLIQTSVHEKAYFIDNILQNELKNYFPNFINNKKIFIKLYETSLDYNSELEKKFIKQNDFSFYFKKTLEKINETNAIKSTLKSLIPDNEKKLREFKKTNLIQWPSVIKKKFKPLDENEAKKDDKNDLIHLLIPAKRKLSSIRNKLKELSLLFPKNFIVICDNPCYQITRKQLDINECLNLIEKLNNAIHDKVALLTQRFEVYTEELEKTQRVIEEKNPWFLKTKIDSHNVLYKIFHCGYFNRNLTLKKIRDNLDNISNFNAVENFILNQSFWNLLTYGIIRWPWMDKIYFSKVWAEQLALYNDNQLIKEAKYLLSLDDKEKILKQIIIISEKLYSQNGIHQIFKKFKHDINRDLDQLSLLEQELDSYLNEEGTLVSSRSIDFFNKSANYDSENKINNTLGITLKT